MTRSCGTDASVFTYQDYRNTPECERYEVLDGELVLLPTPNIAHQVTLGDPMCGLYDFVEEKKAGEALLRVAVVLSYTNVVEPDITFVSASRMDIIGVDAIQGAPDLVAEGVSASDPERDLVRKRAIYARHGVGEYWIADPEARSIRVMTLEGDTYRVVGEYGLGDILTSKALKGLALDVESVFAAVNRA